MRVSSSDDEDLDLRVRIGLLGTNDERERSLELLVARFEKPVMKFLADRFADLSSDDRASAVHDAFIAIHCKAVDGTLDVDSPIHPLLFTVAQRRAIDLRRKASRRIRSDAEFTDEVSQYLAGTETGRDWRLLATLAKAEMVMDEFRSFVGTLKGQQRRVASVLADSLPDWLTDPQIVEEVFVRWNIRITVMEVKGAKNALMKKFREIIKQKLL